jgi:hypothetical protein
MLPLPGFPRVKTTTKATASKLEERHLEATERREGLQAQQVVACDVTAEQPAHPRDRPAGGLASHPDFLKPTEIPEGRGCFLRLVRATPAGCNPPQAIVMAMWRITALCGRRAAANRKRRMWTVRRWDAASSALRVERARGRGHAKREVACTTSFASTASSNFMRAPRASITVASPTRR